MRNRRTCAVACVLVILLALHGCLAVRRSDDDGNEQEPEMEIDVQETPPSSSESEVPAKAETEKTPPQEKARTEPTQGTSDNGYDPDEFTTSSSGAKETVQASGKQDATSGGATPKRPASPTLDSQVEDSLPPFAVEIFMACIIIAFAVNFMIGKGKNEKIAHDWAAVVLADTTRAGLTMNFALVGDNSDRLQKVLIKDSQSHFIMHATGRRFCKSLLATLDLKKRHDLFSVMYNQLFVKPSLNPDLLKIQVPLNDCGTFCVAVCNKNEVRAQKADNNDISKFTDPLKLQKLPKELQLLTDCDEVAKEMFKSDGVMKALNNLQSHIRVIHISNKCEADPRYSCMLRCEFKLPLMKEGSTLADAQKMVKEMLWLTIHLIDVTAKATDWLAKHGAVKIKVEKRRSESKSKGKIQQRQQELAWARKDKKAAEEKEKMEKMAPEELRKYEEKKYRQDMKKRMQNASKSKMVKG